MAGWCQGNSLFWNDNFSYDNSRWLKYSWSRVIEVENLCWKRKSTCWWWNNAHHLRIRSGHRKPGSCLSLNKWAQRPCQQLKHKKDLANTHCPASVTCKQYATFLELTECHELMISFYMVFLYWQQCWQLRWGKWSLKWLKSSRSDRSRM